MWANSGLVVGDDGEATFIGTRYEGDSNVIHRGYPGGIINSYKAEYHLIVRSHGPVIPELIAEQLSSLNGGCPPNTCQDLQLSVPHFPHDAPTPDLLIKSLGANSSGFGVEFTSDLDVESLNLYDAMSSDLGPADVILRGEISGQVSGSVVVDPSTNELTFLKTGAPLVPDTYTLTLHGGERGVKGDRGSLLETNGDGTPYSTTFTVPPEVANTISVGVPDFVRGPGQRVGIPLSISEGTGVREVALSISYDPELLEITSAAIGTDMPDGAVVSLDTSLSGVAIVQVTSPTALPAGAIVVADLQASVPATAADEMYAHQQVIDVHSITLRDGDSTHLPAVDDDGLHLVSYFGDVSGNGTINASDAVQVARIAAALDSGFASTLLTDPNIAGDVSANGEVNAGDASLVAQFAAGLNVAEIPAVPSASSAGKVRIPSLPPLVGGDASGRPAEGPAGANLDPLSVDSVISALSGSGRPEQWELTLRGGAAPNTLLPLGEGGWRSDEGDHALRA